MLGSKETCGSDAADTGDRRDHAAMACCDHDTLVLKGETGVGPDANTGG